MLHAALGASLPQAPGDPDAPRGEPRTAMVQRLKQPTGRLDTPFNPMKDFFTPGERAALSHTLTFDNMGYADHDNHRLKAILDVMSFLANPPFLREAPPDEERSLLTTAVHTVSVQPSRREVEYMRGLALKPGGRFLTDPTVAMPQVTEEQVNFFIGSRPQDVPFYIIAPRPLPGGGVNYIDYAKAFISREVAGGPTGLVVPSRVRDSALRMGAHARTAGWVDMDNPVFFFRDWGMFDRVCQILNLKHNIPQPLFSRPARPQLIGEHYSGVFMPGPLWVPSLHAPVRRHCGASGLQHGQPS
ncbi:MAG: hypothetical protein HY053_04900 [Proteobacteria bacterium]|nr:hypothetical protein [Pseudomonadota bacterium]